MRTIHPETKLVRVLTLGVTADEMAMFNRLSNKYPFVFDRAATDFELWQASRNNSYDFAIVGENSEEPQVSYLVWLLKSAIDPSHIVVLQSSLPVEELERLERFEIQSILDRPVDEPALLRAFDRAESPWRGWRKKLDPLFNRWFGGRKMKNVLQN